MIQQRNLLNLRDVLADLFFDFNDSVVILRGAGLSPPNVRFDRNKAINNWTFKLDYANRQAKIEAIIDEALKQYPDEPLLKQAKSHGIDEF